MRTRSRSIAAGLSVAAAFTYSSRAEAYRPFDGTDADVAELHEFELELGPVGYLKDQNEHLLLVPKYVLNYGIAENVELVVDGRAAASLDAAPGGTGNRVRYDDSDVFIKALLRRGVLQGGSGPSVALEAGPLLPSIGAEQGFGASLAGILSLRNAYGTVHFNAVALLNRGDHEREIFAGAIIEGPFNWRARPVAELYYDREFGGVTRFSALGGIIVRANEDLAFDVGLRIARDDAFTDGEIRGGLTWTFPVF